MNERGRGDDVAFSRPPSFVRFMVVLTYVMADKWREIPLKLTLSGDPNFDRGFSLFNAKVCLFGYSLSQLGLKVKSVGVWLQAGS